VKDRAGPQHRHAKVITYSVGTTIRYWTNIPGKGDVRERDRYYVCTESGLVCPRSRNALDHVTQLGMLDQPLKITFEDGTFGGHLHLYLEGDFVRSYPVWHPKPLALET
jgi:hypothetical protein